MAPLQKAEVYEDDGLDIESFRLTPVTEQQTIDRALKKMGLTRQEIRKQGADGYFEDGRARSLWMIFRESI